MLILAHGDEERPHDLHELMHAWAWEPYVWIGLALAAWLYWRGVRRMWRDAGETGRGVKRWEANCYAGGWIALFVALISPLHPMGRVLFSAHMTQHEILMLVAAPLLVLGRPLVAFLWALPPGTAKDVAEYTNRASWQRAWRLLSNAFAAWLIHGIVLWMWH